MLCVQMGRYSYERLSEESASLLAAEGSRNFGHSGSTLVFEMGPLGRPDGGVDFEAIRGAIESRLHRVPHYRRKLRWIPFERHPVWVDDPEFNLDYHLRHTSLPRPGSADQLRRVVARVQSQRLDRSRPLWEYWVVEGLEGGRFALVTKTHSALHDSSGADLLQAVISANPEEVFDEGPPYRPQSMPSAAELVRDEVLRQARLPRRALQRLRGFAAESENLSRELRARARAVARALGYTLRPAPGTPLNGPLGPHRRFDHLTLPLADAQAVRLALGGKILDVVLATVAGAVARYLGAHYVNPATLDFRVAIPVSLRPDREAGGPATGERAFGEWLVELPVWERDPLARFQRIRQATAALNRERPALGAQTLFSVASWTGSDFLARSARVMASAAPANMRISCVPGPRIPIHLRGARLLELYGKLPLRDEGALSVAVFSYAGRLCIGLNADFDRLPDLARFTEGLGASFRELARAAQGRGPRLEVVRTG
jgi:WS/DGAT/MGAT family acyltransferase